jgi:hypothetical protein
MDVIELRTQKGGRAWTLVALLLSLPTVIFGILHALYAPSTLPEFLDLVVAWTITLTGIVGAVTTLAAVVAAVIATLQNNISGAAKVVMWIFVSLSLVACACMAVVCNRRVAAFENFFYQAIKDHILANGRITKEESAWLRRMLHGHGTMDDERRKLLHELRRSQAG